MDNSIKALGKIRDSIISGKISESRLRKMMDTLKSEYGDDVFKTYDLNSVRQYVYTKPYYERLVQLAKNGACSQEFFIHLLRVREAIKKQKLKHFLIYLFFSFQFCCSIFTLGFSLHNNAMLRTMEIEKRETASTRIDMEDQGKLEQIGSLVNNEDENETREAE